MIRFYLNEQKPDMICRYQGLTETQFRLIKSRAKARFGELGKRRFSLRSASENKLGCRLTKLNTDLSYTRRMATVGGAGDFAACILMRVSRWCSCVALAAVLAGNVQAQRAGVRGAPEPPRIGKTGALYDVTGYWVSVVTEDWRHRMVTPPKGDYTGVVLTEAGRKLADSWDPAKDAGAGEQCRAYGAPGIMRLPGRLHITWQDDRTMKVEVDAGTQTRLLYFGTTDSQGGGWQGLSQASWEVLPGARGQSAVGSLKVVTTRMKPGYLRKNGVPYSTNAVLTEYIDRIPEPDGQVYLLISATLEDPANLAQPFVTTSHYRKQADATGWNPTPCSAN